MSLPDPKLVAKHLITLLGGVSKARHVLDAEHELLANRWAQDISLIGRILRAHLFVEYCMGEYLRNKNPALGSIDRARLTFGQKIELITLGESELSSLLPGVRLLNTIRNRLAHTLHAQVTETDKNVFLKIQVFRALREALANDPHGHRRDEPIDILEDFAKHAGIRFHSSTSHISEMWNKAIEMAKAMT